jgi:hypothetical protein
MPHIRTDKQPVTQITVIESEAGQAEALSLMTERIRFMAHQQGFISISAHRSLEGQRLALRPIGRRNRSAPVRGGPRHG